MTTFGNTPGVEVTTVAPHQDWPLYVNGHSVFMEEDLEDGTFFFYCDDCSTGHGLGVGKVKRAKAPTRAMMKKYVVGMFMMADCDHTDPSQGDMNTDVDVNTRGQNVSVNVSGDLDAPTKQAIVDAVKHTQQRRIGQLKR